MNDVDQLRLEAAKAARLVVARARRDDATRMAVASLCSRHGKPTLYDVADVEPQIVIDFADGIESMFDDEIPRWMGGRRDP